MTSTSSSPAGRRISKAASPPLVPAPTEPPAEPLAFLVADLDSALQALTAPALAQAERTDSFHRARLYLQQVQALATRGVAQGDLTAPRRALEALFAVRPFVDAHYQELSPEPHLALELEAAYCSLAASDEALERLRDQARLADPKRSPVERSVLALPRIYLNGGRRGYLVSIEPSVLVSVLGASPVDCALED